MATTEMMAGWSLTDVGCRRASCAGLVKKHSVLQLELRPGTKKGMARWVGRPRRRHDPWSLRMGGGWIRVGRIGSLSFRS